MFTDRTSYDITSRVNTICEYDQELSSKSNFFGKLQKFKNCQRISIDVVDANAHAINLDEKNKDIGWAKLYKELIGPSPTLFLTTTTPVTRADGVEIRSGGTLGVEFIKKITAQGKRVRLQYRIVQAEFPLDEIEVIEAVD